MKIKTITSEFVEFIPDRIEEGVLYISERYHTAIHKCCCGCGQEVVTPLSPAEWKVRRAGDKVSLWPSIGNWSFPCRSHYVIRANQVLEAGSMTEQNIQKVKARDIRDKTAYIDRMNRAKRATQPQKDSLQASSSTSPNNSWFHRLMEWWNSP